MILRETVPFIVQQPYAVFGKVGRTASRDSSVQLYSRPMYSNVIVRSGSMFKQCDIKAMFV